MADLLGTDEFLVNRNDVTYTQQQETLMATLQDTDHLLINRAGQTYKITGSDLINSVIDPLEVTVILAPLDGYTDTEVTAVPVVSGGKQPDGGFVFTYQWVTADDAVGTNKTNIAGANAATFTPDNAQVDKYLGCVVSTTDALGTSAEGESYIGPIQVLAQAPVIADVVVSEIYDGSNRFTDKEFPYVTTMAIDGEPNPTYELKAKLSGTTFDFDVLSDVITDVEGGGIATCETDLIQSVQEFSTSDGTTVYSDDKGNVVGDITTGTVNYTGGTPETPVDLEITIHPDDIPGSTTVIPFASDDQINWTRAGSFNPSSEPTYSLNSIAQKYKYVAFANEAQPGIRYSLKNEGQIILTFPNTNGFDCFETGDVVRSFGYPFQESDLSNSAGDAVTTPANAYDGEPTTSCLAGGSKSTWLQFNLESYGITVKAGDVLTVYLRNSFLVGNTTNIGDTTLTFLDGSKITGTGVSGTTPVEYIDLIVDGQKTIQHVRHYTTDADKRQPAISGIALNGNLIVDEANKDKTESSINIIGKDEDANTITVDGGEWQGTDGTGNQADGDTKLFKQTPYDTKLTVASSENLELLTGDVFMTDGSETPATQTPYKLVTTDIESVGKLDVQTEYYQKSYPRPAITDLGTRFAPKFDWNHSELRDHNSGNLVTVGDTPGDPSSGCAFLVYFPDGRTASQVSYYSGSTGTVSFYNDYWGSNDGVTWEHLETVEPYVNGSSPAPIGSSNGKFYKYFAYARNNNGDTQKSNSENINTYYGFNSSANYRVSAYDGPELLLTFPGDVSTNPDLQYFQAGDVVQEGTEFINAAEPEGGTWLRGADQAFDGLYTSFGANAGGGKYVFWEPGTMSGNFVFWRYKVQPDSLITVYYNDGSTQDYAFDVSDVVTSPDNVTDCVKCDIGFQKDVAKFGVRHDGGQGADWVAVQLDGQTLVDTGDPDFTVISTGYPDSNTMVVDGGEWAPASNQSEVWSNSVTGASTSSNFAATKMFDGVTAGTGNRNGTLAASGGSFYEWTTTAFPDASEVTIYYTGSNGSLEVNGSNVPVTNDSNTSVTVSLTGGLTSIKSYSGSNPDTVYVMIKGVAVDGKLLIDQGVRDLGDTHVEYQTGGGQGSIVEVNTTDNTLLVTNSGDGDNRWIAGNYGEGSGTSTDFYVAPANAVPISQDYAWGKLQIINNKAQVTGIQKDDPGFLPVPAKDYSIKFPAVFPTGNEPDVDLPRGACVAAIVAAENSEGRSVKESNCFMPLEVNPEGAAGPITDSTPTQLTVASNANLGDFSPGDNLVMVTEDNVISNYTMQTSAIESSDESTEVNLTVNQSYTWSDEANFDSTPSNASSYNYTNMFNNGAAVHYGNVANTYLPYPGSIVWNAPAGANLSGDIFVCSGFREEAGSYPAPVVFVNDSTTPLRQLSTKDTSGAYGYIVYRFFNPGPVDKITIVSKVQYDTNNATKQQATASSFGVGTEWLVDPGKSATPTTVTPAVMPAGNLTTLTFADPNPDLKYFKAGDVVQNNPDFSQLTSLGFSVNAAATFYVSRIRVGNKELVDKNELTAASVAFDPNTMIDIGTATSNGDNSGSKGSWANGKVQGTNSTNDVLFDFRGGDKQAYIEWSTPVDLDEDVEITCTVGAGYDGKIATIYNSKDRTTAILTTPGLKQNTHTPFVADTAESPFVKVISTGYPDSNTMVVDGGNWDNSNQSQVWSNALTSDNGFIDPASDAFDGDTTTKASTNTSGILTFSLNLTVPANSTIEMFLGKESGSTYEMTVNVDGVENVIDGGSFLPVPYDNGTTINTITVKRANAANSAEIRGIKINGKLLVDAVNDSQVWSNFTTGQNQNGIENNLRLPATNAFDGNSSTVCRSDNTDDENFIVFNYSTGVTVDTSFAFTIQTSTPGDKVYSINGGAEMAVDGNGLTTTSFTGTLTNFKLRSTKSKGGVDLQNLIVDGKELIDPGVRDFGDSEVTYGPVTGTGTFQSADLNANTITMSVSNDRWIDNTNRLGTDFYCRDNITVLNADNPKHVAMQQAIADAFTAFPEKVNERRTSIASSFYRLMEGETLSAADYTLLEETVLDAVNAVEPFALDGFYPLYYTSAKADAASSLDSHHTHNINGVNYYMPDGGTLYHGTYLAPETTTTPAPTPAPTPTPTPTPEPTPEPTPDFDSGDSSY